MALSDVTYEILDDLFTEFLRSDGTLHMDFLHEIISFNVGDLSGIKIDPEELIKLLTQEETF